MCGAKMLNKFATLSMRARVSFLFITYEQENGLSERMRRIDEGWQMW